MAPHVADLGFILGAFWQFIFLFFCESPLSEPTGRPRAGPPDGVGVPVPEVYAAVEAPPAAPHAPPVVPAAAPGENQVILRGRLFTRLKRRGEFSGYSIRCPVCNTDRDLTYVASGMTEDEALNRLCRWVDGCLPGRDHRTYGGRRLLKDLAT